jgi:SAM-dependent methyltransferase
VWLVGPPSPPYRQLQHDSENINSNPEIRPANMNERQVPNMYLGLIPDGPAELKALISRQVPIPFLETHFASGLARAVMAATKLGVFESLTLQAASATEIASRCGTEPDATQKLLIALAGSDYLYVQDGRYALTPTARTWLVAGSPQSLVDAMLFEFDAWDLMSDVEEYVRTGAPVDLHERMTGGQWKLYQRSMRALAGQTAPEVAENIQVPRAATDMIDVGGSHGHYSVALCRRYPCLRSVVLDLPEAVRAAAPLLANEKMGDHVVHVAADALSYDYGVDTYDVVLLSHLAHHFSAPQNADLFQRLGQALRPHGVFAVIEPIRPEPGDKAAQFAALDELYFGLSSRSGTWTARDIAGWLRDAGLNAAPQPIRLGGDDTGLQVATKTPHQAPQPLQLTPATPALPQQP